MKLIDWDEMKDFGPGDTRALISRIGGMEVVRQINADELVVRRVEPKDKTAKPEILIEGGTAALFDKNGRRIPPKNLQAAVCDPDRKFYLIQPKSDYANRMARASETLGFATMPFTDFHDRSKALLDKLASNELTGKLLKAVHLPIVVPMTEIVDLGRTTEEFVAAAEKSYKCEFPSRSFKNYRKGELEGHVTIVEGSRYEQLVERIAAESAVGIWFPNPLQGFSVDAQREQMSSLPAGFILSGPLDSAIGWMMYPDVVGRDYHTPVNDCSAVSWRSAVYSLYFRAFGADADFDYRACLGCASGRHSGGLLFLG